MSAATVGNGEFGVAYTVASCSGPTIVERAVVMIMRRRGLLAFRSNFAAIALDADGLRVCHSVGTDTLDDARWRSEADGCRQKHHQCSRVSTHSQAN